MKAEEIGEAIHKHLQRFSSTPEIAIVEGRTRYWNSGACRLGGYISVRYIAYQGSTSLTKEQAEKYLAWLDAGNVGRHYQALEEVS